MAVQTKELKQLIRLLRQVVAVQTPRGTRSTQETVTVELFPNKQHKAATVEVPAADIVRASKRAQLIIAGKRTGSAMVIVNWKNGTRKGKDEVVVRRGMVTA